MIDPIQSLAFSMHSNPGVYALLLGSGVSRSAQIPTGWEITLDLIRKLAVASGESAEPSPETWFEEKYGEPPDYSKLLNELAKTPAERQQLLRPYFEPNEKEREEGAKQPTAAHRAIAQLVVQGFVKVIITTNFDRLIEQAASDAGVVPTVLSSPDQVKGALPLIHTQCCLFKLNGDYLDTRIRNTSAELDEYAEEFNQLLDRIFDEFGLIVCGWSGEWDGDLRNAFLRTPSRRFTTYWALRGEPSGEARQLIAHRQAEDISIADADSFFHTIQQTVESIQEFSRPHPLSTEVAVTSLKRYLSEPRYRIQLSDLIGETVERAVEAISDQAFDMNAPPPDRESVTARVRAYEAACSTLLSIAAVGGSWAEDEHHVAWGQAVERLMDSPHNRGMQDWLALEKYPGMLLLYALGLGAVYSGKLQFLSSIFKTTANSDTARDDNANVLLSTVDALGPAAGIPWKSLLADMERHHVPLNDWVHDVLRQPLKQLIRGDQRYSLTFDRLEILIALGYFHLQKYKDWYPIGAFVHRYRNRRLILQEVRESIDRSGPRSPYVASGFFGESPEECSELLAGLAEFIEKCARSMGIYR